ncbi:MAG TPA: hypothetical protein VIT41_07880 [Microlunatus sp.]
MSSKQTTSSPVGSPGESWTRTQRAVAAALAALLALLLLVAALTPPGRHQLLLTFTHRPAVFTELYLAPEGPVAETVGATTTVRFGIRSHEAQSTDFAYRVVLSDGVRQSTAQGSVLLRVGEAEDIEVRADTASLDWERLEVVLVDRPERLTWIRTRTNEVTR